MPATEDQKMELPVEIEKQLLESNSWTFFFLIADQAILIVTGVINSCLQLNEFLIVICKMQKFQT